MGFVARDWHKAVLLCLFVGIVQDGLRKATFGQSHYFILLVGVCFALVVGIVVMRGYPLTTRDRRIWHRELETPFAAFVVWLGVQAIVSLTTYGNPILAGVGLLSYTASVPALLVGYHYALQAGVPGIAKWLKLYVIIAGMALITVYLEFAGYESQLFGEIGRGITIYDVGTILRANAGIFRSSEIAAWHAATAASFVLIIAFADRVTITRLICGMVIAGLVIGIGMLTGRRKLVVQFLLFSLVFFALLLRSDRQSRDVLAIAGLSAIAIGVGVGFEDVTDLRGGFELYLARTATVFNDIWERFVGLGLEPILWAYNRFGLLGGGLGIASQGAGYAGSAVTVGAGEGGLGKIMAELGAPGLVFIAVLLFVGARHLVRAMTFVGTFQGPPSRIAAGLFAFLVSNIATFVVATPVFADLNILIMLGLAIGFLVACPSIELAARARRPSSENATGGARAPSALGRPGYPTGAYRR